MIQNPAHGEVYSTQHYVIKFVSDLRQVGCFLQVLPFPPPIKTDHHDIAEILLKVALNTINLTPSLVTVIFLEDIELFNLSRVIAPCGLSYLIMSKWSQI